MNLYYHLGYFGGVNPTEEVSSKIVVIFWMQKWKTHSPITGLGEEPQGCCSAICMVEKGIY